MGKMPSKAADNIYCKARLEAAKYNPAFASREGAANEIGVSKESLTDYELGLCKVVPVDKVVIMAGVYNASQLLNYYCCNECPIGKKIMQPIDESNVENLCKFAISAISLLNESSEIQKYLLKIGENGLIDESKEEDLKKVVDFFCKLEQRSSELRMLVDKYYR